MTLLIRGEGVASLLAGDRARANRRAARDSRWPVSYRQQHYRGALAALIDAGTTYIGTGAGGVERGCRLEAAVQRVGQTVMAAVPARVMLEAISASAFRAQAASHGTRAARHGTRAARHGTRVASGCIQGGGA